MAGGEVLKIFLEFAEIGDLPKTGGTVFEMVGS